MLAAIVLSLSLKPVGMIAEIAAVAFALAGNTIFPAFLMGIWWSRTNAAGVVAGMLVGLLITFSSPLLGGVLPVVTTLFPITSSAFLGAPLVVLVMIVASLLTRPPSDEMTTFLARNVHDVSEH